MSPTLRGGLSLVVSLLAVSCQTYDFEPVTPLAIAQTTQKKTVTATQLKPDLMILLDKSGSMALATNPSAPGCTNTCPMGCTAACPTRITELRSAMQQFLSMNGDVARMGLTIFPADNVCTPAGAAQQLTPITPASDSMMDLNAWASGINTQIQNQTVVGGTPTGGSLAFVGTLPELNDSKREDFVLLLTDGLPNCNSNNTNACTTPSACKCTLNGGMCGAALTDQFCRAGCLDLDGAVQAVKDLRARQIRTIVVGFGADFSGGDGFTVLNAMALAGGFQRTCPNLTNAECGTGGMCDTTSKVCQTAFYSAANAAELAAALAQISAGLSADTICKYTLEATPSSQDLVSVLIDGVPQQSGPNTWKLEAGQIIMQGDLCTRLGKSSSDMPIQVEIRVVQSL